MIEKDIAIDILEDIENSLYSDNWKHETLKTISIYMKNIEVSTNRKIKKLMRKHQKYMSTYGEDDKRTIKLVKKIDDEMLKIYNK